MVEDVAGGVGVEQFGESFWFHAPYISTERRPMSLPTVTGCAAPTPVNSPELARVLTASFAAANAIVSATGQAEIY